MTLKYASARMPRINCSYAVAIIYRNFTDVSATRLDCPDFTERSETTNINLIYRSPSLTGKCLAAHECVIVLEDTKLSPMHNDDIQFAGALTDLRRTSTFILPGPRKAAM